MKKLLIALLLVASVADAAPRSNAVRRRFMRLSGHPHGWPGHVIDHIIPLCGGGADAVWNLQWETIEDGKRKDVTEKQQCALLRANRKRWPR